MTGEDCARKRFAVDVMLGKLAKWLRLLGFDSPCMHLRDKAHISELLAEGFIPVTRNTALKAIEGVLFIVADRPPDQLKEAIGALPIKSGEVRLLHRCLVCNTVLLLVSRQEVFESVPDFTYETHLRFYRCPGCNRVYWPGSHKGRMIERLARITGWTALPQEKE
jgi:uncharacterized protein